MENHQPIFRHGIDLDQREGHLGGFASEHSNSSICQYSWLTAVGKEILKVAFTHARHRRGENTPCSNCNVFIRLDPYVTS